MTPLFILQGANGQEPGAGRAPRPGNNMVPLPTMTLPNGYVLVQHSNPNYGTCGVLPPSGDPHFATEIVSFGTKPDSLDLGPDGYPTNGVNGIPGGFPGDGGPGGFVVSNLMNLANIVANQAGQPGLIFRDSQEYSQPGKPNPAYHVYCNIPGVPPHADVNYAVEGLPAMSPPAKHPKQPPGDYQLLNNSLAWVRARNIEAVLQYAEDLFLSRRPTEAGNLFSEYVEIVSTALKANPAHKEAPVLSQLLQRLKHRQIQVSLGMDYYGNPPGWVPLLSLEVAAGVFNAELDRSANGIYLSLFLAQQMQDKAFRAKALTLLMQTARDGLSLSISNLNDYLNNQLPTAKDQMDKVVSDQNYLAQELMLREQELRTVAQSDASKAQAAANSIEALREFAAVLTLVPVAQPTGAVMGALISAIAQRSDLWTTLKAAHSAYSSGTNYAASLGTLLSALDGLDLASADFFEQSLNAVPTGSSATRGDIIQDAGAKVCEQAAGVLSAKSSQTVPADLADQLLQQYEDTDPDYQSYVSEAKDLLVRKQVAFAKIEDIQHSIAMSTQEIASQIVTLDASASALRDTELAIDTRVLASISQLGLEANRRLQYYLYLVALAFEYRLLKPYNNPLTVQYDVTKLNDALSKNLTSISAPQVAETIMAPFNNQLSSLAADIVAAYTKEQKPAESSVSTQVRLTDNERAQLGNGSKVHINLSDRPEFKGYSQENLRIQNITLKSFPIPVPVPPTPDIHIIVRHLGVSLLTIGGDTYGFRHLGYNGDSMITWVSVVDVRTGEISNAIPSPGTVSLLLSQLRTPSDKFVLFASPGLNATLEISVEPKDLKMQLSDFTLTVEYSFDQTAT